MGIINMLKIKQVALAIATLMSLVASEP